jgi:hypothetical protein
MQEYTKTDTQLHQLAQILSKFNRNYLVAKSDDSHTNLAFDPLLNRLISRWSDKLSESLIMTFNIPEFRFKVFNRHWDILFTVDANNKSQIEIEESLSDFFSQFNESLTDFNSPMHFQIPDYQIDHFKPIAEQNIKEWTHFRSMANDACNNLLNHFQTKGETRIWPHHFDTGVYIEPTPTVGLGFGLAMEDEMVGQPYFYMSGYGLKRNSFDYSSTPNLSVGKWHTEGAWKGAVLELSLASEVNIIKFIKETSSWFLQ